MWCIGLGEIRKVQKTPSGTFFVCLPKDWAERHGLKKGSTVVLSETSDGKLLVDAEYGSTPSPRVAVLKPGPYLSREITGKYLLGFDIIRVEGKDGIGLEVREDVKRTASRLVGLEIIEEDYSKIVLQCLLEPSGFPPDKILKRAYALAAGMHRDVVNAIVNGDVNLAKSVIARDEEVNRLYFLLIRILRTIIQNPSLSERLGVKPIECLDFRLAASLVENIGDECVRAAYKVENLMGVKLTDSLKVALLEFHKLCFEAHENAVRAFLSGDVALAVSVGDMHGKIAKVYETIETNARVQSPNIVPHLLAAMSALMQIYEHSVDIADLVRLY